MAGYDVVTLALGTNWHFTCRADQVKVDEKDGTRSTERRQERCVPTFIPEIKTVVGDQVCSRRIHVYSFILRYGESV